jgi:hypothetical protein
VGTLTNELGIVARADLEDKPTAVYLNEFSGGDHMTSDGRRGKMTHVDQRPNG